MERFFVPYRPVQPHHVLFTVLRGLLLGFLFWAVLSGPPSLIVWGPAVLVLVIATSIFVAHELLTRGVPTRWVAGSVTLIIIVVSSGYMMWMLALPPALVGPLLPADDPMPPTTCHEKVGLRDLIMILGANRLAGDGDGPFNVLNVHDCPVLKLQRVGAGLMVDAYFYDWDNDIAFRIRNNIYEPETPLELTSQRPDSHTLVIMDHFGQEVLYVRFLNPGAVRIRGRFLCGEQPQVLVQDETVLTGGVRISGIYYGLHRERVRTCTTIHAGDRGIVLGST